MDIGKLDEAIEHFKEALKIDPERCSRPLLHGSRAVEKGKTDAAIKELRRSLEMRAVRCPALTTNSGSHW